MGNRYMLLAVVVVVVHSIDSDDSVMVGHASGQNNFWYLRKFSTAQKCHFTAFNAEGNRRKQTQHTHTRTLTGKFGKAAMDKRQIR